eukprot:Protomagalhaensia_wolfi_Nauph_80__1463@NODE_1885_length_1291_cov_12_000799_g1473_i0_p1_GENE_NODE_1885_length_1291_cov_12_000799_g1473_i0NODE_1885_length_1291_cov_12_000799_g1473_i0_p1_ORF_typecomplete_len391_score67_01IMP2_N/PF18590_1/1_1e15_NODE_1885_length_1291_cov_12_000799_g1473_i0451217
MGSTSSACRCCESAPADTKSVVKRDHPTQMTKAIPQTGTVTLSQPVVNRHMSRARRAGSPLRPPKSRQSAPGQPEGRLGGREGSPVNARRRVESGQVAVDSVPRLRGPARREASQKNIDTVVKPLELPPSSSSRSTVLIGGGRLNENSSSSSSYTPILPPTSKQQVRPIEEASYPSSSSSSSHSCRHSNPKENQLVVPDRRRISISVDVSELGEGCYLQYSQVNQGTLSAFWSKRYPSTSPSTAVSPTKAKAGVVETSSQIVAFLSPAKPVPAFKYKGASRRQDLVKFIANNRIDYYRGWMSFIKIARTHEAQVRFLPAFNEVAPVKIIIMDSANKLRTLQYDQWEPITTEARAIAVIPGGSEIFTGVNVMDPTLLIQKANECGGAAAAL